MTHYFFIMTDTEIKHFNIGYCEDIKKAIDLFSKMPTMKSNYRQNILVYLEELSSKDQSEKRLNDATKMSKKEKNDLIELYNPNWVELKPGINFEI